MFSKEKSREGILIVVKLSYGIIHSVLLFKKNKDLYVHNTFILQNKHRHSAWNLVSFAASEGF